MNDIIFEVVKLVVMVVALLIGRYVIPWIKAKMETEKVQHIAYWVKMAVLMAQQVYGDESGADRKDIVLSFIKQFLAEKHLEISDEELDILIEAAVKQMKIESSQDA